MENGSINNIENIPVEQASGNKDERNKPVNKFLRFLMSVAVIAALAVFVYAIFWFLNNGGT